MPRGFASHPENINRKGRPKRDNSIAEILRKLLDEPASDSNAKTKREMILRKVVDDAFKGDNWARQFIAERTEGKAIERIEAIIDEFTDDGK